MSSISGIKPLPTWEEQLAIAKTLSEYRQKPNRLQKYAKYPVLSYHRMK